MTVESEILIEAGHTERNYWRDLFRYRELFSARKWSDATI
jgi:lipopolysaccharide transport system permease protein